ncbi:MAG: PEP-CTERM sorting domain-containing protein [Armatimonadota bacterium]
MKKVLFGLVVFALAIASASMAGAVEWHAWGVHGGAISSTAPGTITAVTGNDATYHWNKSNWSTRTGQKAFYSTNAFNGQNVSVIQDITYTVTAGYWGNVYFNVMVQDANGKKAILSPSYNSATNSGWTLTGTLGKSFCVFEAESGWTGTSATGWYAADWDEVKNLTIANGPFAEFPDTVTAPHASAQGDALYTVSNWYAWGGAAASDGLLITFGQSTGTTTPTTTITGFGVTSSVPEPGSIVALLSGLAGLAVIRRRK